MEFPIGHGYGTFGPAWAVQGGCAMDLAYGEEYEAFRREVRTFLERHRDRASSGMLGLAGRPDERVRAWQRLLIEHGYAARTIPREYGGHGAEPDLLKRVIIDEEFARAGVSRGVAGQGPDMLVPTLLEHGTVEQKRRWVGPTIRGEVVWCQGYSEPGAGSDLASVQTRGVLDDEHFVVNGQKIWTTSAHFADMMFALVRTEPDASKHAGLSYLLIPMDTPGIEVRPLRTMTGGAEFNEVFFTDVRVPAANVVGRRGDGWTIANTTLRHERNMLGASAQLETAFQALVQLMHAETANGVRAIDSPILRDRLLRLQARVLTAKYHSLRLLTHGLRGEPPGLSGLVVKLVGCQLAHDLAALAVDAMGELGVLYHHAKYERAAGLWQLHYMLSIGLIIGGGTAQIQKNIIAERGLGLPREPRAEVH
jgi:alkylation response protein AidB-like acyl-CoA dehydrogenase